MTGGPAGAGAPAPRISLVRNAIGFAVFMSLLAWFIAASVAFHPRRLLFAIKPHLRLVFWILGIRPTIAGLEGIDPGRTYVYMVNHVSYFDHFLILAYLPGYFVGLEKVENSRIPIYAWAGRRWGQIPIHREDRTAAIESCRIAERRLAEGTTIVLFPEGTRTRDGALAPFKRGPFHIAVDTRATVVPVALRGLYPLAPRGRSLVASGPVEIRVGRPIPPVGEGHEAYDALSERVRAALLEALG